MAGAKVKITVSDQMTINGKTVKFVQNPDAKVTKTEIQRGLIIVYPQN